MKRSKLLLIAGILGLIYFIYIISYFWGITTSTQGTEAISAGLASAIVAPHIVCVGIAVIFNWVGFGIKARWAALTAGILYAVSIVLFFMYAMFVIIQMILCFIAFAKMKKKPVVEVIEEVKSE